MIKIFLLIFTCFIMLSCGSNNSPAVEDTVTSKEKENNISNKFGEWEVDNEGTKYREDFELRDALGGHELVKYTRTDGGQFGGSSGKTKFTLCSDGSLKYYHQSLTTVSVDDTGGSNASEEDDHGTWRAIENANGLKLVMMKSAKYGRTGYMEVKPTGGSKVRLVWFNEWQEFLMKKIDC